MDQDRLRWLGKIDIFRGLSPMLLRHVVEKATEETFAKGEMIIERGAAGECMYVLLSGQVHIPVLNKEDQHLYTSELGPGQIFGEMALLTGQPRRTDVIAAADCVCLSLSKSIVDQLMRAYPDIAQMLTAILLERVNRSGTPQTVGKFVLLSELARGSMAIVYDGLHPELERPVAIKMLHHELVYQPQFAERFRNEAKIIAHLRHPYIVEVFDLEEAYATFFIIMEKVKGIELQHAIQTRGQLPAQEVRRLLHQLLKALSFAHQHGVIHRDLKPSNVMLDVDGNIKLMDFGIALLPQSKDRPDEAQMLLGTPHFMAPEQHRCEAIDHRADIYSLGLLAYNMLTGSLPFEGNVAEIAKAKQKKGALRLKKVMANPPADLARLIEATTQHDPKKRPGSCEEVIDLLEPIAEHGYQLSQLNAQSLTFVYPANHQPMVRALLEKYERRAQSLPHVATHVK